MTVAVYHNGYLYTDSLNAYPTGGDLLFKFHEKVFKHPSGRWMFIRPGINISLGDFTEPFINEIHSGLVSYYAIQKEFTDNNQLKETTLRSCSSVSWDSVFMDGGILITKNDVWFKKFGEYPIPTQSFCAIGAGKNIAISHFGVFGNAKNAISCAAKWDPECGGKIRTYKQSDLLPFPSVI